MAEFRVIAAHQRSYESPIAGNKDDALTHSRREDDEPGWKWCKHGITGLSGWVPEAFIDLHGSQAILNRDYNALELSVPIGESLTVTQSVAGWSHCIRADGAAGWVPSNKLVPA